MEVILKQLGKHYRNKWVFRSINAVFYDHHIYRITGCNGSGKTALLKCIAGLSPVSEGEILINGRVVGRDIEIPPSLGAIIETPGFLPDLSGIQNLSYLAGLSGRIDKNAIKTAMLSVGLNPDERKKVGKYSLGMRQRLGIAQAIMASPDLLLLDEPFNSLDKAGIREMYSLLQNLKIAGKCILIVNHNDDDDSSLTYDQVWTMQNGSLILERA